MPTSRRNLILLTSGILGFGVCFHVCASLSECLYTMIPPIALAIFLLRVDDWRQAVALHIRPGLAVAVGLFAISLALANHFLGPRAVLSWRFWIEAATCMYFMTAMVIVLLAVRRSLLSFACTLNERWQLAPRVRMILCDVVPLVLLVAFALPLSLAFANVHRFKRPNLTDPREFFGRDFEEIEFASADGTRLRGWWIPAKPLTPSPERRGENCPRTLIICHGIVANRSVFLPFVETGDWLDANVLIFDLRGHGDSGGRTITLGYREKDDILAAIAYARREKPAQAQQVIGMGISLGAASLAEAAPLAEPPLDAVILDSCFTSTRAMTSSVLDPFPACSHPWLMGLGAPLADWHAGCPMMEVAPDASIRELRSPVLFLHSRGDPLIPSAHSIRLHEQARGRKQICIFELPGHCDAFFAERERYRRTVMEFCECVAPRER